MVSMSHMMVITFTYDSIYHHIAWYPNFLFFIFYLIYIYIKLDNTNITLNNTNITYDGTYIIFDGTNWVGTVPAKRV